jgi:hypothetical protein
MDVPRVPPVSPPSAGSPATGDQPEAGTDESAFSPGQRLFARVLQTQAGGQALIELGGEKLLASTPFPVRAGDELPVVVRGVAPLLELEIEAPPVAFSERAYAVAAIRQAWAQATSGPPLTPEELDALERALERSNWGSGPPGAPGPRLRLLELLRPVSLTRDATPLASLVRDRVAAGGVFFESHAARAAGGARVPAELQSDVRWLLAALAPEAASSPEVAALRQRLVERVGEQQLETALARVRDGEVRLDIPVAFGHQHADARLVVGDDGPPPLRGGRPRGRSIALTVTHPELGPVHAGAHWQPGTLTGELQIRFAVRDQAAAAVLGPATADLTSRLQAAGFRHVGVAVVVDPGAAAPSAPPPPDEPPPGGSIVSALA